MPAITATALVRTWIAERPSLHQSLRRTAAEKSARDLREDLGEFIRLTPPPGSDCRRWVAAALRSVNWERIRRELAAPDDGRA